MSTVIGSEVNYRVYEYKHVRYNDQHYSCKLRRVYEKWEYLTLCGWIKNVSSNCKCTTTESMYFLWMSDTFLNRIWGKENLTQVTSWCSGSIVLDGGHGIIWQHNSYGVSHSLHFILHLKKDASFHVWLTSKNKMASFNYFQHQTCSLIKITAKRAAFSKHSTGLSFQCAIARLKNIKNVTRCRNSERYVGWSCVLNCFMVSPLLSFCWSAIPTSLTFLIFFQKCMRYTVYITFQGEAKEGYVYRLFPIAVNLQQYRCKSWKP